MERLCLPLPGLLPHQNQQLSLVADTEDFPPQLLVVLAHNRLHNLEVGPLSRVLPPQIKAKAAAGPVLRRDVLKLPPNLAVGLGGGL